MFIKTEFLGKLILLWLIFSIVACRQMTKSTNDELRNEDLTARLNSNQNLIKTPASTKEEEKIKTMSETEYKNFNYTQKANILGALMEINEIGRNFAGKLSDKEQEERKRKVQQVVERFKDNRYSLILLTKNSLVFGDPFSGNSPEFGDAFARCVQILVANYGEDAWVMGQLKYKVRKNLLESSTIDFDLLLQGQTP